MGKKKDVELLREGLSKCLPSIIQNAEAGDITYVNILIKLCDKILPEWKAKGRSVDPAEYVKMFEGFQNAIRNNTTIPESNDETSGV